MNSVLFAFLMRRHRLATALALLIPILIAIAIGLLYPTYAAQRKLLEVFKFSTSYFGQGQLDLFSADGSFTLPFQHPLCLLNHALVAGIGALGLPAGERGRGALDMLLASPLERGVLLRTLSAFAALSALVLALTGFASALLGAGIAEELGAVSVGRYALVALISFGLTWTLSGGALLISTAARDRAQATLWYGVFVAGSFLLDVLARMWRKGEWLGWGTPFGYLRPSRVLAPEGGLERGWLDAGLLLAAGALLHLAAMALESRRRAA